MDDSQNHPRGPELGSQQGRALQGRTVFRLLSQHLLRYGAPAGEDIDDGLYAEIPTADYGPAIITDEHIVESHFHYNNPSDRQLMLRAASSILTICFIDPPWRIDSQRPFWFFAARPMDLRPDSYVWQTYRRVGYGGQSRRSVAFFNERDLEILPGRNPLIAQIGDYLRGQKRQT